MDTLFVGRNTIFLPEINSTNSYAIHLLKNVNLPEGTVVHAAHQTQGRGQRGNGWTADAGSNLTASIILNPGFLPVQKQFFLYQVAALAAYDSLAGLLEESQFDIKIKWPNDILVNEKKIAGMLIENQVMNGRLSWSVTGVGINVNQELFPDGLRATSLKQLTGHSFDVKNVLHRLCAQLEKHYLALKSGKWQQIEQNYLSRLFGLNTWRSFETEQGPEALMVCGVSENGLLLLEKENGSRVEADVKELKWLY